MIIGWRLESNWKVTKRSIQKCTCILCTNIFPLKSNCWRIAKETVKSLDLFLLQAFPTTEVKTHRWTPQFLGELSKWATNPSTAFLACCFSDWTLKLEAIKLIKFPPSRSLFEENRWLIARNKWGKTSNSWIFLHQKSQKKCLRLLINCHSRVNAHWNKLNRHWSLISSSVAMRSCLSFFQKNRVFSLKNPHK